MAFSLSPSVQIIEKDFSGTISNLPSSKTGAVLRADTGPANKIIPITSEAELVKWFGKPTAANYKDWFNCWNFLQYTASLYVSRPVYVDTVNNTSVQNAGVSLTGINRTTKNQENLYNADVAELTLQGNINAGGKLAFFNRYVTSNQTVGVSVCSSSKYWKSPIANEFAAVIRSDETSDKTTINDIGGITGTDKEIYINGTTSLVAGSKFITNGGKLFTVKNVYSDRIVLDAVIKQSDVSFNVATVSSGTIATGTGESTLSINLGEFNKIDVNSIFVFGTELYYCTSVTSGSATFKPIGAGVGVEVTPAATVGGLRSNSVFYHCKPTPDYLVDTDFVIPAGTTTINVEAGFNYPVGSMVNFQVDATGGNHYINRTDEHPDEGVSNNNSYQVIISDTLNNAITLDRPLLYPIIITSTTSITDITTLSSSIVGVNLYSTVYDDSVITTETATVIDAVTGDPVTIQKESLVSFNKLFEYEPNWVADEFVTIVFKKNVSNKYEVIEKKLASYQSNARDFQNRNLFANEVFYYGSEVVFCKVTEDDTKLKVETSSGPLVKFVNSYGAIGTIDGTTAPLTNYETVYPLSSEVVDGVITVNLDRNNKPYYDANNYTKADAQNAMAIFADAETFDINILLAHELDINGASIIAETRKDCVAIVAPYNYTTIVGKSATQGTSEMLKEFGGQTVNLNRDFNTYGTYSAIYGNMKYQYDKFNDVNRWMCVAGDVAGLYANTDSNRDPWWAVAGLERGKIKNAIRLAFSPNKQNRDELYVNSINPIMSVTGEGNAIVFGQKTATIKASALDRLNVRRLMIVIEKAIASAVKYGIFEFNDSFTRSRLVGMIEPFLRNVKSRRGVYDFGVICDSTNNTDFIIDSNALVIDVFIKPTKVAEFIQINFNILRSDANITEFIGGQ